MKFGFGSKWEGTEDEATTRNKLNSGKPVYSYRGAFGAVRVPDGGVREKCIAGVWSTYFKTVDSYINSLKAK